MAYVLNNGYTKNAGSQMSIMQKIIMVKDGYLSEATINKSIGSLLIK